MLHNGKVLIYDYDTLLQRNFLVPPIVALLLHYPDIDCSEDDDKEEDHPLIHNMGHPLTFPL